MLHSCAHVGKVCLIKWLQTQNMERFILKTCAEAIITSFKTVGRFSLAGLSMGHVKLDTIMWAHHPEIQIKYESSNPKIKTKNKSRMVLKKQTHIWCAWRWNNLNNQQVTFKTIKDFLSVYMHFRESYLFRNFCCVVFSCSASSENCSLRSGRKDLGRIADRVRAGQRRTRQA